MRGAPASTALLRDNHLFFFTNGGCRLDHFRPLLLSERKRWGHGDPAKGHSKGQLQEPARSNLSHFSVFAFPTITSLRAFEETSSAPWAARIMNHLDLLDQFDTSIFPSRRAHRSQSTATSESSICYEKTGNKNIPIQSANTEAVSSRSWRIREATIDKASPSEGVRVGILTLGM